MAMTEDFTLFFNDLEFADTAVHTAAATGAATPGKVIFDANGLTLDEYDVQTTGPTATCYRGQWPAVREGDVVAIGFADGAVSYLLRAVTPLGDGQVLLLNLARTEPVAPNIAGRLLLDGDLLLLNSQFLVLAE